MSGLLRRGLACAALLLLPLTGALSALEAVPVTFSALGGSPLLLNVHLEDPDRRVAAVIIEAAGTRLERSVSHREGGTVSFPVSPFPAAGAYDLYLELRSGDENKHAPDRRAYRVAFVDYVWGRDNFRFANDTRYRGDVDSYSEMLYPWLNDRFGRLPVDDRALILLEAYEILRGQLGLCYAFAGTGVRYHRNPELLPRFHDSVYELRETNRTIRDEMSHLQNDLVFQRFVVETVEREPQSHEQIAAELAYVRAGIDRGEPVVVGILAPDRHHAMVAYGYMEDLRSGAVTVVTANNWDRDERDNHSNPSVENLRLNPVAPAPAPVVILEPPGQDGDGEQVLPSLVAAPPISWPEARHAAYRNPTHMVAVEVEEKYHHDRHVLDQLVEHRRARMKEENRRTLLFEGIRSVRLTDVPAPGDQEGPSITRINENAIVSLPAEGVFELEVTAVDEGNGAYRPARLYKFDINGNVRVIRHTMVFDELRRRITVP